MSISPFIPNQIYKRSSIHDQYGGNRQGGIAPSAKHPYIFIFSGKSGAQYGYIDWWPNPKVFAYTGEGRIGNMEFTKGNLALRDHIKNGKRVFLFEYVKSAYVKFISELELFDAGLIDALDHNKSDRIAIRFFFKRVGVSLPITASQINKSPLTEVSKKIVERILPNETERKGLVTTRVGQGAYREDIIHRWEYKCAVTGFDKIEILIASHIVPWAKSTDQERLDVHNGLLLSPTYDALFDRHLISFDTTGKILLPASIDKKAYLKIGVTGKEVIRNLSTYNEAYLERHREKLICAPGGI